MSIIESLEQVAVRKKSTDSERSKPKWSKQDEKLIIDVRVSNIAQIILQFGEDVSLLHSYFPDMTRKQVKRKVKEVLEKRKGLFSKLEQRAERERRKSFFDE